MAYFSEGEEAFNLIDFVRRGGRKFQSNYPFISVRSLEYPCMRALHRPVSYGFFTLSRRRGSPDDLDWVQEEQAVVIDITLEPRSSESVRWSTGPHLSDVTARCWLRRERLLLPKEATLPND